MPSKVLKILVDVLFFLQTSKIIHEACKRLAYWPAVLSIYSNYALFYKCKTAFAGFHQRNQPTVDHFTGIISDTYSMEKVVFTSCIWKNEWKKHRVVGLLLKVNTHQFLHWASVPKLCLCFYYICCKPSETSHSAPEQTSEKQKQRQDCAGNVLVQICR